MECIKGVIDIDLVDGVIQVLVGICLLDLNQVLVLYGLCFFIDLGVDFLVGGMLVVNIGGVCLICYGDVCYNMLGLQVLLMQLFGELLEMGNCLYKNNIGFDWKQLFIGMVGSYGIVM